MLPDRVSNPGPLTYESGALPIALRGPAELACTSACLASAFLQNLSQIVNEIYKPSGHSWFGPLHDILTKCCSSKGLP